MHYLLLFAKNYSAQLFYGTVTHFKIFPSSIGIIVWNPKVFNIKKIYYEIDINRMNNLIKDANETTICEIEEIIKTQLIIVKYYFIIHFHSNQIISYIIFISG